MRTTQECHGAEQTDKLSGCSSGSEPAPWSARPAARSSGSTTTRAIRAAAAIPGLWGFGPALREFGNDLGLHHARRLRLRRAVRRDAAARPCTSASNIMGGGRCSRCFGPAVRDAVCSAPAAPPGVPAWALVDDSERRLAARRPPAHCLQHDEGAPARAADRRHLRARTDGDRLHRGGAVGFMVSTHRRLVLPAGCRLSARRRRSPSARPRRSSGCSAR